MPACCWQPGPQPATLSAEAIWWMQEAPHLRGFCLFTLMVVRVVLVTAVHVRMRRVQANFSNPSRSLNGLRHLALTAPNLEDCERFCVDVLGMEVLNRAGKDLVYLICGNDNLSLGRAREKSSGVQADGSLRLHRR